MQNIYHLYISTANRDIDQGPRRPRGAEGRPKRTKFYNLWFLSDSMQHSGSLLGDAGVKVLIAIAFPPFPDYQVTGTRVTGHLPH